MLVCRAISLASVRLPAKRTPVIHILGGGNAMCSRSDSMYLRGLHINRS